MFMLLFAIINKKIKNLKKLNKKKEIKNGLLMYTLTSFKFCHQPFPNTNTASTTKYLPQPVLLCA